MFKTKAEKRSVRLTLYPARWKKKEEEKREDGEAAHGAVKLGRHESLTCNFQRASREAA